ncbi:hypothetical protein P4O66_012321, partial [Electrophorus voltai]
MKLAYGDGLEALESTTVSKPERLGQASTASMPRRLFMHSTTSELLTCLGACLCQHCCLLKDLTADEPVQWLQIVDHYLTLTGWQEQSFIITYARHPGTIILITFIYR